jgi:hypothetical protein
MRTTREVHHKGTVEIWVDGALQFEPDVRLTKREIVEDVETLAGTQSVLAGTTWHGRFRGVAEEHLRRLQVVGEFELRLPDDRRGLAVLPNGRDPSYLRGFGDPPF